MKPCHMGNHQSKVLSKSYPMITNMTGFIMVFKKLCVLLLWIKVLEGLIQEANLYCTV